jgi:UDP-N-acetylmuramoyl-tripeptide--D-alanyl-D-alanine ligase
MRADTGPFSAHEAARACNGTILCGDPDALFHGVSTDSRDIRENDLFVPLQGPTHDGHDFQLPALEAGARGSLTHRDSTRENLHRLTNHVLIQVQDTLRSLSDLASAHRKKYPIPLIAVTGSSGKTTVKEMIATVLRRSHRPLVSKGNFNNMIGLPMTVLNLNADHSAAVVEAGINTIGEMDYLARAASPDVAVITTVGPVHLAGLGSVENVAREKFKLLFALPPTGTAVVPAGNPWCEPLLSAYPCRVVTVGIEKGDYRASGIMCGNETAFDVIAPSGTLAARLQIPGRHNIENFLTAVAACEAIGIRLQDAAEILSDFTAPAWRTEVLHLPGNRELIRDCYNANPQSVKAGLEVLACAGNSPRMAVLADMAELGEDSVALHKEIGREAALLGIDRVVFVGSFGPSFAEGFVSAGGNAASLMLAEDKEAAWKVMSPEVGSFGTILVKGSRVMRMEVLADRIVEEN